MSEAARIQIGGRSRDQSPRLLGIFAAWRLQAYGYGLAIIYAVLLVHFYHIGAWLVGDAGVPVYIDFTCAWVAGSQALQGQAVSIYDPAEFLKVQDALVGAGRSAYPYWPYPPIYFLILAPLAMLPYVAAFLTWDLVTLVGYTAVVYLIIRRRAAIALALASPFAAWNLIDGQSGFLTASLLGASLLVLGRRPVLAGVFIACLTYKPQFGVLIPVALAAFNQWRTIASAAATAALLAGISAGVFGTDVWAAFPRAFIAHSGGVLLRDPDDVSIFFWGHLQTIYGLIRTLYGGAALAWLTQGVTALAVAIIVWLVWRSPARYALKAATLSAAALIATPYAQTYDFAAIAIPVAFLARDQIACGFLRGEQSVMLALFGASLVILVALASVPLGPIIAIALLAVILRRVLYHRRQSAGICDFRDRPIF